MINDYDKVCDATSNLSSPVEDADGNIFMVTQNGDVLRAKEGHNTQVEFNIAGQLSGIAIDKTGKNIFVADLAHQAIICKDGEDKKNELQPIVKDYEGVSLLGPHSLVIAHTQNAIFFTDAGPLGETSLENPKGSLFMIDQAEMIIRPLALNCLAYPTGLALSNNEKNIYVCETCQNRLLRFTQVSQGVYHFSVFAQFEGRFGPTAVAVSQNDNIYVARFEFATNSQEGIIQVLNKDGERIDKISILHVPEITGLSFSRLKPHILYVTENSNSPVCIKFMVKTEDNSEEKSKIEN